MTTKQDYIGSILQSLAGITLSDPSHESLAEIDRVIGGFHRILDPESRNTVPSYEDATEILGAFAVDGFYDAIDDKSRDDAEGSEYAEDGCDEDSNRE